MATLAELMVKVGADISEFQRNMQNVQDDIKGTGRKIQDAGKSITNVGKDLTKKVTLPLVGLGTTAVLIGTQFDSQMSKVQAVSGATGADLQRLRDQAKDLGASTSWSAKEAAEGMEFLARAGWNVDDIYSAMPNVLNLATASAIDLGTASDIASNIISGFGASAQESQRYIDVLAKATASSNTDMLQLGDAMKYVAPVANALGLSVEETASAIGILSDAGIQGSQAGTTLRTGLLNLASPSKQASKLMKELGMEFFDANGKMKPMPQLLAELEKGTANLTEQQKAQALETLFGKEAVSGFMALLDAGSDTLENYTTELENAEGTAQDMADTMNDNLAGAFKGLQSALQGLAIEFYEVMEPAIRKVVETATSFIRRITEMDDSTKKFIIVFGAIAGIIPPIIVGIGMVVKVFGLLVTIVGSIFSPITLVIGAVILLGLAFREHLVALFEKAMEWVQPIINAFKYLTGGFDETIAETAIFGETVESIIGERAMMIVNTFNRLKNTAQEIWSTMYEFISLAVSNIADFANEQLARVREFWNENGEQILQAVRNVWNFIKGVFQAVLPIILVIVKSTWNAIKGVIDGVITFIMGLVKTFSSILTGDFKGMWNGIKQMFSGAIKAIWNLMQVTFYGRIITIIRNLVKLGVNLIKGFVTNIGNFFRTMTNNANSIVNGMRERVVGAFNGLRDRAVSTITGMRDRVVNLFSGARDGAVSVVNGMRNSVTTAFNGVLSSATSIFNRLRTALTNPVESARNTIQSIVGRIRNAFNFSWSLPRPRLPRINVSTSSRSVAGISIPIPSFSVSWNAKGAIFNGATLLGGGQGVGEAGAEAVLPIQHKRYMAPFARAVAENMDTLNGKNKGEGDVYNTFNINATIREEADIKKLAHELDNLQKRSNRRGGRN